MRSPASTPWFWFVTLNSAFVFHSVCAQVFLVAFAIWFAYIVKKYKFYYLPESGATMIVRRALH